MDNRQRSILTNLEYYAIASTATGRLFIDKGRSCYLFTTAYDAKAFAAEVPGTEVREKEYFREFGRDFYSIGIRNIHISPKDAPAIDIPIGEADVKKQAYNPDLYFAMLRLKQTKQAKYLRMMGRCSFIVPVAVMERAPKKYPAVHYSVAMSRAGGRYFILFASLYEFGKWAEAQAGSWSPLSMPISGLSGARKGDPAIVNPATDKLILSDKMIKLMQEE